MPADPDAAPAPSDAPDRRERLLNLLAALIETRAGLTRDDILTNPTLGYPSNPASARRAFERDKATLRAMGVPLQESGPDRESRYRVDPKEYYLPDLALSEDELAALHVAVTAIGLGSTEGAGALMKLGGIEGAGSMPIAELPFVEVLAPLFEASRRRAPVEFRYRDRLRRLEPWGLTSRSGRWYVVGLDHGVDDMRVYRADRIEGDILTGAAGQFSVPADFRADAYLEDRPWDYGDGRPTDVTLLVDAGHELGVLHAIGPDARVESAPDGSTRVRIRAIELGALVNFVLGFGEHVEIVDPPEAPRGNRGGTRRVGRMSRTDAPPQLERVLAMIPWLATHRDVPKQEVADRFGISRDELEGDLALIMMVGVPPYSPGDYINVAYDGDTVDLWLAPYFTRALQLTAGEGLALLAGGKALLAVDGSDPDGPLATALAKLQEALGVSEVNVELSTPEFLPTVRAAAAAGRRIEITYAAARRDEVSTRRIDPGPPFFALGEWYTDAFCSLRGEPRMFRIDRIRSLTPTDETFPPVRPDPGAAVFHPHDDDPRVTIELPRGASWVAESAPSESVEDLADGRQRVTVAVSDRSWLERILLQVGPEAKIVTPADWQTLGADAAARVRDRYRDDA